MVQPIGYTKKRFMELIPPSSGVKIVNPLHF
jgi:hypothetical protein